MTETVSLKNRQTVFVLQKVDLSGYPRLLGIFGDPAKAEKVLFSQMKDHGLQDKDVVQRIMHPDGYIKAVIFSPVDFLITEYLIQ